MHSHPANGPGGFLTIPGVILGTGDQPLVIEVRPAEPADIPAMAAMRAEEWETEAYWRARIGHG